MTTGLGNDVRGKSVVGGHGNEVPKTAGMAPRTEVSELTTAQVNDALLSPMMRHYVRVKRDLAGSFGSSEHEFVLMWRCGDFFESFFEDAVLLSQVCELALTSKDAGKALGARIPMAGIPHYVIDDKIRILLSRNVSVAVVDQVQPASAAPAGKLVERAVTRLITPGTAVDDALLVSTRNSFLAAVVVSPAGTSMRNKRAGRGTSAQGGEVRFGFALADVSTGDFRATDGVGMDALQRLLVSSQPAELLISATGLRGTEVDSVREAAMDAGVGVLTCRPAVDERRATDLVTDFNGVDNVESLGCRDRPDAVRAAAVLLSFVKETLLVSDSAGSPPLDRLVTFSASDAMQLDAACLRNMEIVQTLRDGARERSLQWAVDRTVTAMGARRLRNWLLAPLMDINAIRHRHAIVLALRNDKERRRECIQSELRKVADLERLAGRVGGGRASPRELRWLAESIMRLPSIVDVMQDCICDSGSNSQDLMAGSVRLPLPQPSETLLAVAAEAVNALLDPAPASLVSEVMIAGGASAIMRENWSVQSVRIFRQGYDAELDALRGRVEAPEVWVTALERSQQERTGIPNLRVKHVKSSGYVIRIPRSIGERKMADDPVFFTKLGYSTAQSTKAELRYSFAKLQEYEQTHNAALSQILLCELNLYNRLRSKIGDATAHVREVARDAATLDVLCGFAEVAEERDYCCPEMLDSGSRSLHVVDGRHPVVEQTLPAGVTFVPNSFQLGSANLTSVEQEPAPDDNPDVIILTGPNAAGKSCAMRTLGLICILAQVGSFVPASRAQLGITDRLFTRVGAVDDLALGQSTFQVEMAETACILSGATSNSLVLLDEIGRGTGIVDGIAIAWAVAEHLATGSLDECGPRVVFVTHYHELNELAAIYANVKPFRLHVEKNIVAPEETNGTAGQERWVTTHRVVPGASWDSLGLAVAQRAGFPAPVMKRAKEISSMLRAPSRALGAQLRSALGTGKNAGCGLVSPGGQYSLEAEGENGRESKETPKSDANGGSDFKSGFESGYARAQEEFRVQLANMMRTL